MEEFSQYANLDLSGQLSWRTSVDKESIFVSLVAAVWMFAYRAHIQTLLRGHKYTLFICRSSARWLLEKLVGRFERKDREYRNFRKWNPMGLTLKPCWILFFGYLCKVRIYDWKSWVFSSRLWHSGEWCVERLTFGLLL